METVAVSLGEKSYEINISEGLIEKLAEHLGVADKWFILTDENVDKLYGSIIESSMGKLPFTKFVIPAGEKAKTFAGAEMVINAMLTNELTRRSAVIAFGGGVVGDLAGFCASIYMRGIRYIQVPTTLLAQVDSSVGGKTGVNVQLGKNMAGTFYQPQIVVIDTNLLSSLPEREFMAGMGEVIKYGIIYDYKLLREIDKDFDQIHNFDYATINKLIKRCCEIKAEIVGKDEVESDLRKILNFGHTFGHALETLTNYTQYLHGEAVLIGMYYESLLALKLELISDEYWKEIVALIKKTGISTDISSLEAGDLVKQMGRDKKNPSDAISFIFPTGKGCVAEHLLKFDEVLKLLMK